MSILLLLGVPRLNIIWGDVVVCFSVVASLTEHNYSSGHFACTILYLVKLQRAWGKLVRYCRFGSVLLKSNRNRILDVKVSARMEAGGEKGRRCSRSWGQGLQTSSHPLLVCLPLDYHPASSQGQRTMLWVQRFVVRIAEVVSLITVPTTVV